MAINLASASDGRVDFGDLAGIAGATALSFSLVFKPTAAITDGNRLFAQWTTPFSASAFVCQVTSVDEIGVVITDGVGRYGQRTTDLNLANGSTYRLIITILCGSPPVIHIYVNGVDKTLTAFVASDNVTQIQNSTLAVQVGHQTDEVIDGVDADYAEFAIWLRELTGTQANAFTSSNQYPICCGPRGLLYLPMLTTTDLTDRWGNVTASLTDGSDATHPTMAKCWFFHRF